MLTTAVERKNIVFCTDKNLSVTADVSLKNLAVISVVRRVICATVTGATSSKSFLVLL